MPHCWNRVFSPLFSPCLVAASRVRHTLSATLLRHRYISLQYTQVSLHCILLPISLAVPRGIWASNTFWLSSVIDLAVGSNPAIEIARMHKGVQVVSGGYRNVSLCENLVQCPLSFPPLRLSSNKHSLPTSHLQLCYNDFNMCSWKLFIPLVGQVTDSTVLSSESGIQ